MKIIQKSVDYKVNDDYLQKKKGINRKKEKYKLTVIMSEALPQKS